MFELLALGLGAATVPELLPDAEVARAEAALAGARPPFKGSWFGDAVWLDSHRLLFDVRREDGSRRFRIADTVTGRQGDAFDHIRLARALEAAGHRADPDDLPIRVVAMTGDGTLDLEVGERLLRCAADHCADVGQASGPDQWPAGVAVPGTPGPRRQRSPDGRLEAWGGASTSSLQQLEDQHDG